MIRVALLVLVLIGSALSDHRTEVIKFVKADTSITVRPDTVKTMKMDTLVSIKKDTIFSITYDTLKITRVFNDTTLFVKQDSVITSSKSVPIPVPKRRK